jgi:dihydrofolate synthase / folylpolyglutamate synthase
MPPATQTSYEEAIAHLSALIPELFTAPATSGAPATRRKFSLAEIGILSAALGNPHRQFPSVLIAGTNGKGSTASTLASIARAAGLRVGLYTSPHLERVNERIKLLTPQNSGAPGLDFQTWVSPSADISDETFARLYFRVEQIAQQLVSENRLPTFPSYFELLTALAFLYFAEEKVDLAILEVGMGGRLDATNLVSPILSVITDISLDHQEWLGSTIGLIAREKAGILRPNGALITLPQHPEANQAIGEVATELNVRAISAAEYVPSPSPSTNPAAPYPIQALGTEILVDSPLKGVHQHRNIALAIASAVELAQNHNFPITPAAIAQGIRTTDWPGRLERIVLAPSDGVKDTGSGVKGTGFSPYIKPAEPDRALAPGGNPASRIEFILDVAHNPAGAWALRSALSTSAPVAENAGAPHLASEMWDRTPGQVLIFACLRDKPLREMTQILFPLFDHVILAPIHSPRATEVADLLAAAEATSVPSTPASTVAEAIEIARSLNPARIVISGSVYLVGEARALLLHHKAQNL